MSLEDKIKALLEGKTDETAEVDLLSEDELIESVVEVDAEGNPITEDSDEVTEEVKKDADADGAADTAKIKAGLSKKLEAGSEIAASSTEEPNNKKNNVTSNMQEHITALSDGEDLSEDFKAKASVILEMAIAEGVKAELSQLEEQMEQKLDEAVEEIKAELVESIDGFLTSLVENWMEENQLAIERGIKVDIVENFIDGMKNLFSEHYIEVPEEKLDILDEQAIQIEALTAENEMLSEAVVELSEEVKTSKKILAVESIGGDLTDTDFEKFAGLMENIEYSDDFETKAKTILENYFPRNKGQETNLSEKAPEADTVETSGDMSRYVKALSTSLTFN